MFRPLRPYHELIDGIFTTFSKPKNFRGDTLLKKIFWKRDEVILNCTEGSSHSARDLKKRSLTIGPPILLPLVRIPMSA